MKRVHRALMTSSVVLLVGVGAATYTWLEGYQRNIRREAQSEQDKRFFDFGRIHIARLELRNQHGLFIFERNRQGTWRLLSPVSWPADQQSVNTLADHMVAIKADVTVTDEATDSQRQEYGLDKPQISISAILKDGKQHELLVGQKHNFENGYYISKGKQRRIGIASSQFYDVFTRELNSFRAKEVLPYRPEAIQSIEVHRKEERLYDLRKTDDKWTVNQKPADPEYIMRLLLILTRDLKSEAYRTDTLDKNNSDEMKKYGLDVPSFKFTVKLNNGKKLHAIVSRDATNLGGMGPYLHLLGTKTVIAIYQNFLHDIDKSAKNFRDRTISRFDRDEVSKLKIVFADGKQSEIEKKQSQWFFVGRGKKAVKSWKIDALVMKYSILKSDEIVTENPTSTERSKWRLLKPIHRISFSNSQGETLADIQIGKRLDEKHVFITATGLNRIDSIEAHRLAGFPASEDVLADN